MKQRSAIAFVLVVLLFVTCRKRDAALPDNFVIFESGAQGLSETENSIDVKLKLLRAADSDAAITINLTPEHTTYGAEFTTLPDATSGSLTVAVPAGSSEVSFTVAKTAGVLFDGDEKVIFDIQSAAAPVSIGIGRQFTLSFAEIIANASSATIDGGGPTYPNKVFVDLSANRQTPVVRTGWDLGFYTGNDDYRVILNSSSAMMAKQIDKNDLNQVTAADTVGFSTDVAFSQFAPTTASLVYIDYPNGDLTKTAIAAISATDADNKVYIINRGLGIGTPAPSRGWKKIRIIRSASGGYTLQQADIEATLFSSVDIEKDDAYFFKYIKFENGAVNVEPGKNKWDFAWTYFSNVTNFGSGEVPYLFQDIIVKNRNVEVAKVLMSVKPFEDFNEASLTDVSLMLTWNSSQTAIGSDWRSGGGPGTAPSVRTDRYYVIKDGDNNYYKVRFTALTQNGERGYPVYESVLVKKG